MGVGEGEGEGESRQDEEGGTNSVRPTPSPRNITAYLVERCCSVSLSRRVFTFHVVTLRLPGSRAQGHTQPSVQSFTLVSPHLARRPARPTGRPAGSGAGQLIERRSLGQKYTSALKKAKGEKSVSHLQHKPKQLLESFFFCLLFSSTP